MVRGDRGLAEIRSRHEVAERLSGPVALRRNC